MLSRRQSLFTLANVPISLSGFGAGGAVTPAVAGDSAVLGPGDFKFTGTYLNAAHMHPIPLSTAVAMREHIETRLDPISRPRQAKQRFAKLINAEAEEIALIPSTSYGESFVVGALQLKGNRPGRIVTDILHYDGSLYMYRELEKRGLSLSILPMAENGTIDMNRLEAAVDNKTTLVAISLVSWLNGFEHDLKTVCDIAHKKGAKVYVDAIQGAGAVPIDVRASNVDFLATSTFKWLMGDFGCGFLYVRQDLLQNLSRPEFGYHQYTDADYHFLPGDKPGTALFDAKPNDSTAMGYFEVGSVGTAAEIAAAASLGNLIATGVENIQRNRQPLMERLSARLSRRYRQLTPQNSKSPIISFSFPDADKMLVSRIKEANINFELYDNRFRISPSVYNSMADVDRAIDLLMA